MGAKKITTVEELKSAYVQLRKDYEALHRGMLKLYQTLSDNYENLMYVYDAKNRTVYSNKKSVELLGVPEKLEFKEKSQECPLLDVVEQEDKEKVRLLHKKIIEGEARESKETVKIRHANGTKVVYEHKLYSLSDDKGMNIGVCVGVLIDVTERYIKDMRIKRYSKIMNASLPIEMSYDQKRDKLSLIIEDEELGDKIGNEKSIYFWSKLIKEEKVCEKADIPVLLNFLKEGSEKPLQMNMYSTFSDEYRWYALTGQVKDNILTGEMIDITDYKTKDLQNQRLERILECLDDSYTLVAEVDLEQDTYDILLCERRDFKKRPQPNGKYSALNTQLSENVTPEYQQMRLEFGSIDRLRDILQDRKKVECEYMLTDTEMPWRRAAVQVMEYDEEENPKKAILFHTYVEGKEELLLPVSDKQSKEAPMSAKKNYVAKALLVEDFAVNAEYAMDILGKAEVEVEWARNAEEAVRSVKDHEKEYFSFVLMDTKMPDKDGYEATKEIKQFADKLPVIGLSVVDDEEHAQLAKAAGMEEHMQKPIHLAQVFYLVDKYVKKSE